MNRTLLLVLAAASLVTGGAGFVLGSLYIERMRDRGGSASEPDPEYRRLPADAKSKWMTGFTLTERNEKQVQWSDLKGQVTITNFFFTSCPAQCLQQSQKVGEVMGSYRGKPVTAVSITCDPDIDSPERLREYADRLKADPKQWLFLTGELTYIRRVEAELFSVMLDKQTHTERLIVADKWGNLRGSFLWNKLDEVTKLRLLVDELLAETEEPAEFVEEKKKQAEALAKAQDNTSASPESKPAAAADRETN
jgi:cytochrome oxidase Cu insertion factor (SCO1/SenC/PrrC family)